MALDYRLGNIDDIDAVFTLNQQSFSEAWSKKSLFDVMSAGFDLYVCKDGKMLIAYLLSQDILDETHIMQIAVLPDYQRQGIGRQLTQLLFNDKSEQRLILLEVRASNKGAQAMYHHLGFQHIGTRKAYYRARNIGETAENAIVMQYMISAGKTI
ncbi:MAG: ribosomal protein S18-alanine N-acetyltransferase [Mariprofundaceae bacterium]|nr:ribosomal protein S18-alanine N-acetyltransferase [Mariprofundaceae bacterium]